MTATVSLHELLETNWGYSEFRPLQQEAAQAVLEGRDSLVILPTGGGKSICFQLPALTLDGLAVVVSPLISLMKDQVDQLRSRGIEAACINSTLLPEEKWNVDRALQSGKLKLLYVAPERLLAPAFLQYLKRFPVQFFAIDEAHCISQWGHDFRPEYRDLARLREIFPEAAFHAYTATATEQVRTDIVRQLRLKDPEILVGSFDRPNLHYSVSCTSRTRDKLVELFEVIDRHKGESGIVYCISRKAVDELAETLRGNGIRVAAYHAGLPDETRHAAQDAFLREDVDVIVATVAFGMGIDKTNVRYVVHWGIPKSIEHYQQESGRAGRDGLDSDCLMFFSAGDMGTWRKLLGDLEPEYRSIAYAMLDAVENYCQTSRCRHRYLVEHFGQSLESQNCNACDVCGGEESKQIDGQEIARKILSGIVHTGGRFGARHVRAVLCGESNPKILERAHNKLPSYAVLRSSNTQDVDTWIVQLLEQGFLVREPEYRTLSVTAQGNRVLQGEVTPQLRTPSGIRSSKSGKDISWEGVDSGLFAELRELRLSISKQESVPPYVVFSDATLRDMARMRPSTVDRFLEVEGVGQRKCEAYSTPFLKAIRDYCAHNGTPMDVEATGPQNRSARRIREVPVGTKQEAFDHFRIGRDVESTAKAIGRAVSTTSDYLADFILAERVADPTPWVDPATHQRIAQAADQVGIERMKPIFEHLGGEVTYDEIRISVACLRNLAAEPVPASG